jgi:hypothetical protein
MVLWITIHAHGYADEMVDIRIFETRKALLDSVSKFLLEKVIDGQHAGTMEEERRRTILGFLRDREVEHALDTWNARNEDRLKGFPTDHEELIIQRKHTEVSG